MAILIFMLAWPLCLTFSLHASDLQINVEQSHQRGRDEIRYFADNCHAASLQKISGNEVSLPNYQMFIVAEK